MRVRTGARGEETEHLVAPNHPSDLTIRAYKRGRRRVDGRARMQHAANETGAESPELALRTLATNLLYRVWNGIFAAGD